MIAHRTTNQKKVRTEHYVIARAKNAKSRLISTLRVADVNLSTP